MCPHCQHEEYYQYKTEAEIRSADSAIHHTDNQSTVLVTIETKDWVDEKGREKSKAGFVKINVAPE